MAGVLRGARLGVADPRASRRIAVTVGSAVGEARPLWRCFAAIAAARRVSAPALSVVAPSAKKATTEAVSAGIGIRPCLPHQSSNAAQSNA